MAADSSRDQTTIPVLFYTRPGCCLCDTALEVLEQLREEFPLSIEKVDISQSPDLEEKFGQRIPVGLLGGAELFHFKARSDRLRAAFSAYQSARNSKVFSGAGGGDSE